MDSQLRAWLLDSDPALRWQVERDLQGEPESVWAATRKRTAIEGLGAIVLAKQDSDGQWAGGAYFPADFDFDGPEAQPGAGQPWTATTWSLNSLREWGIEPAVLGDTAKRLEANSRWEYDDLPYWGGEVDCCINGFTLANGGWLGHPVGHLVDWFAEHQLADGGWNCEWVDGATQSSFHSTLNSLKGLLAYEELTGANPTASAIRRRGEEYLLERRLMYRKSDGAIVGPWVENFTYPLRWQCSALNAVDYFRRASEFAGAPPDPRLADAVALIQSKQQADGRWLQGKKFQGRVWVDEDVPEGEPSKWLTLYGLRIIQWWQAFKS